MIGLRSSTYGSSDTCSYLGSAFKRVQLLKDGYTQNFPPLFTYNNPLRVKNDRWLPLLFQKMTDPISLSLTGASLAYKTLSCCIAAYQLCYTARQFDKEGSRLRSMLYWEECRLMQWAEKSLLTTGTLDKRLNAALIEHTLVQIEILLYDIHKLTARYRIENIAADMPSHSNIHDSKTYPDLVSGNVTGDEIVNLKFLDSPNVKRERNKLLKYNASLRTTTSLPKKLYWAAVDKKDLELLVHQLTTFNTKLFDLLRDVEQEKMQDWMRLMYDKMITLTNRTEELQIMRSSVAELEGADIIRDSAVLKTIRLELDPDLEIPTYPPRDQIYSHNQIPPCLLRKLLTDIAEPDSINMRSVAQYENTPVFIEWKEYDKTGGGGKSRRLWEGYSAGRNACCPPSRQKVKRLQNPALPGLHCLGST